MEVKELINIDAESDAPRLSRFQSLWAQAEQTAADNLELDTALDALAIRVQKEVFGVEQQLGVLIRQVVNKQLQFYKRKSLLKWQRYMLTEWLEEGIAHLSAMSLFDDELMDELVLKEAVDLGVELDANNELSLAAQLQNHLDERLEKQLKDSPNNSGTFHNGHSDEQIDIGEVFDNQFDFSLFDFEDDEVDTPVVDDAGMDAHNQPDSDGVSDAVFQRLFRQTAAALHPDRESDPERQKEKHRLMSCLLKARKERDLISVIQLHEKYANSTTQLSVEDENALESVLQDYLSEQETRRYEIIFRSPLHEMAYHEFYDKNPTTVNRRIKKHVKELQANCEYYENFILNISSLKVLKEVLAERYDRKGLF